MTQQRPDDGETDHLSQLLDHLEGLLGDVDTLGPGDQEIVFGLLDGVDSLHRMALQTLAAHMDTGQISDLRQRHPAITWLFDAYAVGVDERQAVETSLASIRPYIESHGGHVDVLDVDNGVVTLQMVGACSGCTASAVTLQEGIIDALRDGFPGFVRVESIEDPDAASHPPPTQPLHQIGRRDPAAPDVG
jgi:Fe-S cluster biogenesis protein NfuA